MGHVNTRITAKAKECNADGHSITGGIVTTSEAISYGAHGEDDWRKRFNTKAVDKDDKPLNTPYRGTGNTTGDIYNVC